MYYFYDTTYILVIIGAIISLIASMNVTCSVPPCSRKAWSVWLPPST